MLSLVDKYSPKSFDEICGQNHIVDFFKQYLKNLSEYPKNIIINGAYGTGKTSTARIFSNELSKLYPTHLYEYDVSIFNKDLIKDIKNKIDNQYSFSKDYRVLIFDEIQSAPQSAQTLFLKTLENNIISDNKCRNIFFLFLTTDSSKLIDTIISRCIELNFLLISEKDIKDRLNFIIEKENISIISENVIDKIVKHSEGHMRNAIVFLDKYLIVKDENNIFCDTKNLIADYMYNKKDDLNNITIYPVNILLRDLKEIVTMYVEKNIDNNYLNSIKFLELYMKFKNYINCIEDFCNVLKILKKFLKG